MVYAQSTSNYCVAVVTVDAAAVRQVDPGRFGARDPLELLVEDERIASEVVQDATAACRQAKLAKFEIPRKLHLAADEWTVENGLLTAAMKLKREALKAKYGARLIELSND